FIIKFIDLLQIVTSCIIRTNNVNISVRISHQDYILGYKSQWWGINNDGMIGLFELIQQFAHSSLTDQVKGIRTNGSRCYDIVSLDAGFIDDFFYGAFSY